MDGSRFNPRRILLAFSVSLAILPAFGCIGMTAQLVHTIYGNNIKAEFTELENERVAVICFKGNSVYEGDKTMKSLTKLLRIDLKQVKGIDLVHESEVYDWFDSHIDNDGLGHPNFVDLGKGTNATKVLAVEIQNFSIKDGQTLYKGRCEYSMTVYDIENDGDEVFAKTGEYSWPHSHGRAVTGTSENSFRAKFSNELKRHLGKHFYDYPVDSEFGRDAFNVE